MYKRNLRLELILCEDNPADRQEFIKFTSADSKRVRWAQGHDLYVGEVSF
jgi:hypothetical protein